MFVCLYLNRMCEYIWQGTQKGEQNERNEKIEYKKSSYINYIRIICYVANHNSNYNIS